MHSVADICTAQQSCVANAGWSDLLKHLGRSTDACLVPRVAGHSVVKFQDNAFTLIVALHRAQLMVVTLLATALMLSRPYSWCWP